ncbi:MAG TPA: PIN domain-containing protein [Hanamia sp.]|jgi:predicted nucleic acid-binding protein|nr:PIN domain-containing protein [Hanamia sp.]
MRIFLDANILVSVVNKEYPLFTTTARILSLADKKGFLLYTSPVCLAITFYFAEKKFKSKKAKNKIQILSEHINITSVDDNAVSETLKNRAINDFEDGLEYYSALEKNCNCIITEDVDDFYFSKIEVLKSEEFFKKYCLKII